MTETRKRCQSKRSRGAAERLVRVFLAAKSPRTARAYTGDLSNFATFLTAKGYRASSVTAAVGLLIGGDRHRAFELLTGWKGELGRRLSAATVNRRMATLRSILRTANRLGFIDWSVAVAALPSAPLRDVAGPSQQEIRRMLAVAKSRGGHKGPRDVALMMLLYGLGLRRSEVIGLDVRHVNVHREAISILGKGRAEREWVKMPMRVNDDVCGWLVMRGSEPGALFLTMSRGHDRARLTANGLYTIVRRLGELAGCVASPHRLRHAAITHALQANHRPTDVQKFSRHRRLDALMPYVDYVEGVAEQIASDLTEAL